MSTCIYVSISSRCLFVVPYNKLCSVLHIAVTHDMYPPRPSSAFSSNIAPTSIYMYMYGESHVPVVYACMHACVCAGLDWIQRCEKMNKEIARCCPWIEKSKNAWFVRCVHFLFTCARSRTRTYSKSVLYALASIYACMQLVMDHLQYEK